MTLIDIIALAKAGYSKKDIERIKAEESEKLENGEEVIIEETIVNNETETESERIDSEADQDIDYKALFEDANKKLNDMELKISELQKANTGKNLSGNEISFEDRVKDSLNALLD